ncbi:methionine-rich copper-binding protein CopC [Rhodoblastus acidophilus]|uniref:copper resistance CopC family protein n=1 Tax=Rhodoblastus acidophilus TaxID=1074 RepID=UPI00222512A9|nr:copper resistance CopC family protein [Rhodoblastus acidophilus]MCW2285272.1 methionine-rich copper-binding protein CopC [Rhodoblastus acidophilus]MCW2334228.1 methionine-rich copper-binding protein CopC [Rhodoblastus acidophilus]
MSAARVLALSAARVLALLALLPASASAAVELDRAAPRVGSTIAAAPDRVVLDFSEAPEGASGEVRDAAGARVDVGGLTITKDSPRATLMVRPLGPGDYSVRWWAKSDDGDETQGRFFFRVVR